MKKLIQVTMLALIFASALSSCTKEEVRPQTHGENGGGGMMEDPIRK